MFREENLLYIYILAKLVTHFDSCHVDHSYHFGEVAQGIQSILNLYFLM